VRTRDVFFCVLYVYMYACRVWKELLASLPFHQVLQQRTATSCNIQQHAATRCNTLHYSAAHCNICMNMYIHIIIYAYIFHTLNTFQVYIPTIIYLLSYIFIHSFLHISSYLFLYIFSYFNTYISYFYTYIFVYFTSLYIFHIFVHTFRYFYTHVFIHVILLYTYFHIPLSTIIYFYISYIYYHFFFIFPLSSISIYLHTFQRILLARVQCQIHCNTDIKFTATHTSNSLQH